MICLCRLGELELGTVDERSQRADLLVSGFVN